MTTKAIEKPVLDPEVLRGQDKLTSEQEEAIRQQAIDEASGKPKEEPKPDVEDGDKGKIDEGKPAEGEGVTEEEKKGDEGKEGEGGEEGTEGEEEEEENPQSIEDLLKKPEGERTDEEKAAVLEHEKKQAEVAFSKNVEVYAKEFKVSEQEARDVLQAEQEIQKNYSGDIGKLARAHRNLRQLQVETAEKLKSTQAELESRPDVKPGQIRVGDKVYNSEGEFKDDLVSAYKKDFPALTKDKEADEIYDMAKRDLIINGKRNLEERAKKVRDVAESKRRELRTRIETLDPKFREAVDLAISKTPDAVIAHEKYDGEELIAWSKGLHYDEDMKRIRQEAFEEGLVKGKEQARIVGGPPSGGSAKPKPKKKAPSPVESLTSAERERALSMYDGQPMTDDEKFVAFVEFKAHEENLRKQQQEKSTRR